jgi:hypothetical protein
MWNNAHIVHIGARIVISPLTMGHERNKKLIQSRKESSIQKGPRKKAMILLGPKKKLSQT